MDTQRKNAITEIQPRNSQEKTVSTRNVTKETELSQGDSNSELLTNMFQSLTNQGIIPNSGNNVQVINTSVKVDDASELTIGFSPRMRKSMISKSKARASSDTINELQKTCFSVASQTNCDYDYLLKKPNTQLALPNNSSHAERKNNEGKTLQKVLSESDEKNISFPNNILKSSENIKNAGVKPKLEESLSKNIADYRKTGIFPNVVVPVEHKEIKIYTAQTSISPFEQLRKTSQWLEGKETDQNLFTSQTENISFDKKSKLNPAYSDKDIDTFGKTNDTKLTGNIEKSVLNITDGKSDPYVKATDVNRTKCLKENSCGTYFFVAPNPKESDKNVNENGLQYTWPLRKPVTSKYHGSCISKTEPPSCTKGIDPTYCGRIKTESPEINTTHSPRTQEKTNRGKSEESRLKREKDNP